METINIYVEILLKEFFKLDKNDKDIFMANFVNLLNENEIEDILKSIDIKTSLKLIGESTYENKINADVLVNMVENSKKTPEVLLSMVSFLKADKKKNFIKFFILEMKFEEIDFILNILQSRGEETNAKKIDKLNQTEHIIYEEKEKSNENVKEKSDVLDQKNEFGDNNHVTESRSNDEQEKYDTNIEQKPKILRGEKKYDLTNNVQDRAKKIINKKNKKPKLEPPSDDNNRQGINMNSENIKVKPNNGQDSAKKTINKKNKKPKLEHPSDDNNRQGINRNSENIKVEPKAEDKGRQSVNRNPDYLIKVEPTGNDNDEPEMNSNTNKVKLETKEFVNVGKDKKKKKWADVVEPVMFDKKLSGGHEDEFLTCYKCSKSIKQRYMTVHLGKGNCNPTLTCDVCEKTLSTLVKLKKHKKIHSGDRKKYYCNSCPKVCFDSYNLKVHSRSHTGEKPFQCEFCPKTFKERGSMKAHADVHSGSTEPLFTCEKCPKSFSKKKYLSAHEKTRKCSEQ